METLQLEGGRELIEQTALHTNLTNFFTPFFAGTSEANAGFHSSTDWLTMITDKESFLQCTEVTGMDVEFKQLMWIGLTDKMNKLSEQQKNILNWKLNQPPSFEEFRSHISNDERMA